MACLLVSLPLCPHAWVCADMDPVMSLAVGGGENG